MKLRKLIAIAALVTTGTSFGATGLLGTFINVTSSNHNGGVNVWYDASSTTALTDFDGLALGTYNPYTGGTLNLTGAEINTWKDVAPSDITGTNLYYRIYLSGSPSGTFTGLGVGWTSDGPFTDASGALFTGARDQKWSNSSTWAPTNVLTGLADGNYVLETYLSASTDGGGTLYANAGGNNFKASFTVVPEPSAALLGLLGATVLLRRRK